MIKICEYGCGQEAKYQFKNGKWCCNFSSNKCPNKIKNNKGNLGHKASEEKKKKISDGNKNKKLTEDTKNKISKSLKNIQFTKKHLAHLKISRRKRIITYLWTNEQKQNLSKKRIGSNNGMFGKKHTLETKRKIGLNSLKLKHSEEYKQKLRDWMLNGHALKMIKAIKKISNEEIKIRDMVKELHPSCEFQYPVLRYYLDVAIPEHKIAIEYDGYYHFCSEEKKQYHKQRQEKIESEGWKFYRVTMFDKFPTLEEVKENLEKLI